MNYKLGREQHGQYERTNKKKKKNSRNTDSSAERTKTPSSSNNNKAMFEIFLNYYKRRLV